MKPKAKAKGPAKPRAVKGVKGVPKCIGKLLNGNPCSKNANSGTKWCTIHDPNYVRKKAPTVDEKKARKDKEDRILDMIATKVGSVATFAEWEEEELMAKKINVGSVVQIASFVRQEIPKRIRDLALCEHDVYPYVNQSIPFSRKIWMIISWHLINDMKSYENLAMTCKRIYKVLITDKVAYMKSPLIGRVKSPRLYFMPIYRVMEFTPPPNLDAIAQSSNLPTIAQMEAACLKSYGPTKTKLEAAQRTSDIIYELLKSIVIANLDPEEDFEEEIPGCGIMSRAGVKTVPRFENCEIVTKTFRIQNDTFLVANCQVFSKFRAVEKTLMDCLVTYDKGKLIRLMRVN